MSMGPSESCAGVGAIDAIDVYLIYTTGSQLLDDHQYPSYIFLVKTVRE